MHYTFFTVKIKVNRQCVRVYILNYPLAFWLLCGCQIKWTGLIFSSSSNVCLISEINLSSIFSRLNRKCVLEQRVKCSLRWCPRMTELYIHRHSHSNTKKRTCLHVDITTHKKLTDSLRFFAEARLHYCYVLLLLY